MDIKQLTQEVILKNMTLEQQTAVLESVQASVKEAKVIQKQKIAENVDLVLQALKRIEADMLKRVDGTAQTVEARVKTIKDGKDGKNGVDGKAGKDGKDGRAGVDGRNGKDGINGVSGERGQDGVGVQNAHIDFDGSLVIALTNGQELNVGEVVPFDVAEKIRIIGNGGGTSQFVIDTLASLQASIDAIPSTLVITDTFVVSSQAAMLALTTAEKGDVAVRTDLNKTFILTASPYSTLGNWQELLTPTDSVTSVNGYTGTVVLTASNVGAIGSVASADGSIVVTTVGTAVDLSVSQTSPASVLLEQVRNTTGATLTKGTAVYISGATGQIPTVSKALATGDSTSAQTLGLITSDLANNSNGYVTIVGLVTNINTSAYTDGAQLYLSPTTAGTLTATKPYAPNHLVYVAIVAHAHPTQGKLIVKVQNGYELDELHNVSAQSPTNGQTLIYNSSTSLWEKASFPTFNQNTTGSAGSVVTTGFSIEESGGKLVFKYGATTIASMSSTGVITSATNIVSNGTP